jgi:predicted transcriptional regulator
LVRIRRNRENSERIADVLNAVSEEHFYKSEIMKAANLSNNYVIHILIFSVDMGFLAVNNRKYSITDKGKTFLEKLTELTCRINEVRDSLEKLEKEKENLAGLLNGPQNQLTNQADFWRIEQI